MRKTEHSQLNILGEISSIFVKRSKIVILLLLAILLIGYNAITTIPREFTPEVTIPTLVISTVYPGATAEEVESLVTDKIEKELDGLKNLKKMKSDSQLNFSLITLEFETGIDIKEKQYDAREKLNAILNDLPVEAENPMISYFDSSTIPLMIINISGNYDDVKLRRITEDIKDYLTHNVEGLGPIQLSGGRERELQVIVNPYYLLHHNGNIDEITQAINRSNLNYPGGSMTLSGKKRSIITKGKLESASDLEKIVVRNNNGSILTISDLAKVNDGLKELSSYSRVGTISVNNGIQITNALSLSITKKKSADIFAVSQQLNQLLLDGEGIIYPEDITISISGDNAKMINDQLTDVTDNAFSGLILVILVMYLLLGFKESLIVSTVIPFTILIAIALLNLFGMSINSMTLFSLVLAIGLLVDNAIVIMENIMKYYGDSYSPESAAINATNQIAPAVTSSTLTTLAAFFPMLLTPGLIGQFIKSVPLTIIFSLTASLFVALIVTPSTSKFVLSMKIKRKQKGLKTIKRIFIVLMVVIFTMIAFKTETGFGLYSIVFGLIFGSIAYIKLFKSSGEQLEKVIQIYSSFLSKIISSKKKRYQLITVFVLIFIVAMSMIPLGILKLNYLETYDVGKFYIDIETPNGSLLEDTLEVAIAVENELNKIEEVKSYVTTVGTLGEDSMDFYATESGSNPSVSRIQVDLIDKKDRNKSSQMIVKEVKEQVKDITGGEIYVNEYSDMPTESAPISIGIVGNDLSEMKKTADSVYQVVCDTEGTTNQKRGYKMSAPEIVIKLNPLKASEYGLSTYEVATFVRSLISGVKVSQTKLDGDEIDIRIMIEKQEPFNIESLKFIKIQTMRYGAIPLEEIVTFDETVGFQSISHESKDRIINVTSEIELGYNTLDITNQIQEKINDSQISNNTRLKFSGESEEMKKSFKSMSINMLVAIIAIYIILSVQFNSLLQPIFILLTVPMSLIGVVTGLIITDNSFGFMAFLGIVALVGIAVNDAIVLIDNINYQRTKGVSLHEAVIRTGKARFIPVIATTVTTAGGILPLTLRQDYYEAMGYSIAFGLCFATLLTLVLVPVIYTSFEEKLLKPKKEAI